MSKRVGNSNIIMVGMGLYFYVWISEERFVRWMTDQRVKRSFSRGRFRGCNLKKEKEEWGGRSLRRSVVWLLHRVL